MIDSDLALDTAGLTAIRDLYRQAPALTDRAVRRDLVPFARHFADKRLRVEPGEPHHPLRWTPSRHPEDQDKPPNTVYGYYSRQKAAYFATDGFGAGIPYRRRHKLVRGWHVRADYADGFGGIRVYHDSRIAMFVFGQWQQRYHADTGWAYFAAEMQVLILELDERMLQVAYWVGVQIAQGGLDRAV